MNFTRLLLAVTFLGLGSQVLAGNAPTSPTVSPVVILNEIVDANGTVHPTGSTSAVTLGASGFGPSTPKSNLPQNQTYSLSTLMMPAFNPVSPSTCPAGSPLTVSCVLSGASSWAQTNATALQTTIGNFESTYGYSSAWLSYSQSLQINGQTRTLSWAMFVNAQGVGTWGAPQLSGGSGAVLYVSYTSLSAPAGVLPSWVSALNPNAGSVQWQLLDSTLTPIQCADMTAAGCTLPVGGAFDEPLVGNAAGVTDINYGYKLLLGGSDTSSFSYSATQKAATVQALLDQTGAAFALVDYGYSLAPQYDVVSDGYCPPIPPSTTPASSCARAVGQYTYTALRVDLCTCGTANYVNTGSYSLTLQYSTNRNVVTPVVSTDPSGTSVTTMSSSVLTAATYTSQTPSTPFNSGGTTNAGSWVHQITHTQALELLAATTPQVLLPLDGSKLIDAAALLTPGNAAPTPVSSVINGASNISSSAPPVSLPAVTKTGSNTLYWAANPIPGNANTFLAVEARCDDNSVTQFISGYNSGGVEASDSNPNGGFINPIWAAAQQASPNNTFMTGAAACAGSSAEIDVPNSTFASIQYSYAGSASCTILQGVEGAGDVCPSSYTLTSITDPNGDSTGLSVCLSCGASGGPSAVDNNGNITYSCSDGTIPSERSSLYQIPLNAGGTTCSQSSTPNSPSTGSTYTWVTGPWPTSPPSCAWESRSVTCQDQYGVSVANTFCTGPQPADAQFMTGGCTYAWVSGAWSAPSSSCSTSALETRSVTCTRSDGSTFDDSFCAGQTKPDSSQTLTVTSGCPYQWGPTQWGTCTGGTFSWTYSAWTAPAGCGNVTQSRTTSGCSVTANSGSAQNTVSCIRQTDGASVALSNCLALPALGAEPPTTEPCTPTLTSNALCGAQGALTQTGTDYSTCSYSWVQSGYPACTGGTGTWGYTQFLPTTGCGSALTQTRTGTCSANPNSVTQTQTVTCYRSDGASAADSKCTTPKPSSSQACTPTSGYSCGTESILSQPFSDYSACTYSWSAGSWSSCSGGSGTWSYSTWSPTTGCGSNNSTRTATCNPNVNSGSETRPLSCVRSDGATAAISFCSGVSPPASQACTPSDPAVCGAAGQTVQSLTNGCTYSWQPGAWGSCHP